MFKRLRNNHALNLLVLLLVLLIAALCYLPFAHLFGFYRDDWYLIYIGVSQGSAKFTDVFAIDRPFRAPLVSLFFDLFGASAPIYTYTGFIARLVGALSLYWIVRQVWRTLPKAAWIAALLFLVYPGFLDMPAAFDFQSHFWAFGMGMLSIALTLRAVRSLRLSSRVFLLGCAAALQAANLLLMEYFIGIEGLRVAVLVYLFAAPQLHSGSLNALFSRQSLLNIARGIAWSVPALLVSAVFMLWRQFFFENTRAVTDISGMLAGVTQSPLLSLVWEPVNLLRDLLNVIVLAWAVPLYDLAFDLRLRDTLVVLGLACLAAGLAWLVCKIKLVEPAPAVDEIPSPAWGMLWVGLFGAALALLPIHLGDRRVIFDGYSRFAWTASAGGVLFLVGLGLLTLRARFRQASLVLLVAIAAATHAANSISYVTYTQTLNAFWWQVSWRIPQIQPDTLLAVNYAGQSVQEDYFVWGPANLVYYPHREFSADTPLALSATTLAPADIYAVLSGQDSERERRSTISRLVASNLLVLSMPTPYSCVHVLDGEFPELTETELPAITLLAPASQPDRITLDAPAHTPPTSIFGAQPPHTWCYYYTQADLARQRADWVEVARLGDEAATLDLHPIDAVEMLPFIQAYAVLQRETEFKQSSFAVLESPFLRAQTCRFAQRDSAWAQHYPAAQDWLLDRFCP